MTTETSPASPAAPALAVRPRERLAFIPKDFDDAFRQADALSKSGILPDALKGKPHDILVTIVTGAELGLSPMQAIREVYVVKGKGYISSLLKVALAKQSPDCEYFRLVESTDDHATFETKRRGEGVTRMTYSIEDAKRAGLYPGAKGSNWDARPKLMCRRRCGGELVDEVYPELTRGTGIAEDLQEKTVNDAPTTFAPPPPSPEDAQVVPPTPPAAPVKTEKPVEKKERKLSIEDVKTESPSRAPGEDDVEPPAPKSSPPKGQGQLGVEPASDLAIFAEVKEVTSREDVTEQQLDDLSPRARSVQGPVRKEISDLMVAARARLKARKAGK